MVICGGTNSKPRPRRRLLRSGLRDFCTGATTFTYDAKNRRTGMTTPDGNITTYTWTDDNQSAAITLPNNGGQRVSPAILYQPSHCGKRESRPIDCVTQNRLNSEALSVPPWRLFTNHAYFYHEIFCHGNSNSIPDGVIIIGACRVRRCPHLVAIF